MYVLAACCSLTLSAQRKSAASRVAERTPEQLIQDYRFDDAARMLQKEIAAAQRGGRSTVRLEADLARANLGADMLRGVERIIFVDSVKVKRSAVLDAMKISPEAGKVCWLKTQVAHLDPLPKETGRTAYVNELGDRIFFAASDSVHGAKSIWSAYKSGDRWIQAQPLDGMGSGTSDQDYPFVMPDGVTLYYAAQGSESLGGYDLFVTRYDSDSKRYLKAENMGMPFNSPANDYMLLIDEAARLGWLVTDRNQGADSVCIYTFVPTDTRDVYELTEDNRKEVVQAARIHAIAQTQKDAKSVADARKRMKHQLDRAESSSGIPMRYVVNDSKVYTSLTQFRSEAARRIAMEAMQAQARMNELLALSDKLQKDIATGGNAQKAREELSKVNDSISELRQHLRTLYKNMRVAELK